MLSLRMAFMVVLIQFVQQLNGRVLIIEVIVVNWFGVAVVFFFAGF